MDLAHYIADQHDGETCARPGCPGRATWTNSETGELSGYCSPTCSVFMRELERNADWLAYAEANDRPNSVEYARAQREILHRLSDVLTEYRNTRRPAEHRRYIKQLQAREAQRRTDTLGAIDRMRAAGHLGKQARYTV